jgi:hypothetical protein
MLNSALFRAHALSCDTARAWRNLLPKRQYLMTTGLDYPDAIKMVGFVFNLFVSYLGGVQSKSAACDGLYHQVKTL